MRSVSFRLRSCALIATATVAGSAMVSGCGGARVGAAAMVTPTPEPTPNAAARAVARDLRADRVLYVGEIGPDYVANVECSPAGGPTAQDYDCSFILDQMDPTWFVMRRQADGSLTKHLGSRDPVAGSKTPAQVSRLLASDDWNQRARSRTRDWSCAPSPRLAPDGSRADSHATGMLCTTTWRVDPGEGRRYVEFATDGTVRRDYLLPQS